MSDLSPVDVQAGTLHRPAGLLRLEEATASTWRGSEPLALPGGPRRTFLEDGDRVTLTGWAEGDGYRVGFGEATGVVRPARES